MESVKKSVCPFILQAITDFISFIFAAKHQMKIYRMPFCKCCGRYKIWMWFLVRICDWWVVRWVLRLLFFFSNCSFKSLKRSRYNLWGKHCCTVLPSAIRSWKTGVMSLTMYTIYPNPNNKNIIHIMHIDERGTEYSSLFNHLNTVQTRNY